jgi:hypothetical protein
MAFQLQQWLRQRASMLRYTYIAHLFRYYHLIAIINIHSVGAEFFHAEGRTHGQQT